MRVRVRVRVRVKNEEHVLPLLMFHFLVADTIPTNRINEHRFHNLGLKPRDRVRVKARVGFGFGLELGLG